MAYMLTSTHTFDKMSAVDAALDTGALFQVWQHPLTTPNGTASTKHFMLGRTLDDGTEVILNAKAARHNGGIYGYHQIVQTVEDLFPGTCTGMRAWDHGTVLQATFDLGEAYTFADGDSITSHGMLLDSVGGIYATQFLGYGHRPFCTNSRRAGQIHLKAKRTKNYESIVFTRAAALAQAAAVWQEFIANTTSLKAVKLTAGQVTAIIDAIFPAAADDARKDVAEAADKRRAGVRYYLSLECDAFGTPYGNGSAYGDALRQAIHTFEFHDATVARKASKELKQAEQIAEGAPLTLRAEQRILATV